MAKCPNCFTDLAALGRVAFGCTEEFCGPYRDDTASAYEGTEVRRTRVTEVAREAHGQFPTEVRCGGCGLTARTPACPVCHFQLPGDWLSYPTVCVAMAGARATGKSFYIAVMKRQLEKLLTEHGLEFSYATPATRALYEEHYERPLYEHRRVIKPTPRAAQAPAERAPMLFRIGSVGAAGRAGVAHLVLRDVAGEDLERGEFASHHFDFFNLADAIVFMFDPLRVEAVQQMLTGLVTVAGLGADPTLVLESLLAKLRGGPAVPIALVLSKVDVLQELAGVEGSEWSDIMSNWGAAFLRDPSMRSLAFDERDARLLDLEVRSLLQKLGAGALIQKVDQAAPARAYFATSALGQHSLGEDLHPRGISPFRCVDPLKWILARAGILPSEAGDHG
ncbi:MAG: TRAFAC clade GTPase domain-containing protein [Candidatus Nanopelagicales bacterium]